MTNLSAMAPHTLCYKLDELCPPYCFTYSGNMALHRIHSIHVYSTQSYTSRDIIARFDVDENNPLEYVVTKILLQFSGGTDSA